MLAAWSEFGRDTLGGPIAEATTDVFAADDQVLAIVGAASDQNVDVRVVGVPVIDGNPIEFGAEIALDILHQLAREAAQVRQLGRILGRDDEPEMVPVIRRALGEGLFVGRVRRGVEHIRGRSSPPAQYR